MDSKRANKTVKTHFYSVIFEIQMNRGIIRVRQRHWQPDLSIHFNTLVRSKTKNNALICKESHAIFVVNNEFELNKLTLMLDYANFGHHATSPGFGTPHLES